MLKLVPCTSTIIYNKDVDTIHIKAIINTWILIIEKTLGLEGLKIFGISSKESLIQWYDIKSKQFHRRIRLKNESHEERQ